MAYETESANFVGPTNVVSDAISPALVSPIVVAPHIYYEPLPTGTNVKLMRKDGSLTAEEVNESTAHAIDATGQELTQSSVTATCVKLCSNCEVTVEAEQFKNVNWGQIAQYEAEALARDWDDEILALFSSFDNNVTASSVCTMADAIQAAYNVRANTSGVATGRLVGVFDYKAIMELQKEVLQSSASNYAIEQEVSFLRGERPLNGYAGSKAGIDFFETSGLPTSSSDDVALIFSPALCFAGMISDSPQVRIFWQGGIGGYITEVAAWLFCDIVEWNDAAGCGLKSDT